MVSCDPAREGAAGTYHGLIAFIQTGLNFLPSPLLLRPPLLVSSVICQQAINQVHCQ